MSATHSVPSTTKRFFAWSEVIVVLIQLLMMAAQMILMVPCSAVSFVSMIPGKQIYKLSIMHVCVCASKRYLTWCVVVCRRTSYGTVSLQSLFSGRADLGFTRVAFSLFLWNRDFLWFSYLVFCNLSNQSLGTVVRILLELFNEEHHFFCLGGWRTSRTSQVYWFYTIDIYRLCKSPTANRKSWEIIEPLSKTLWKPQRANGSENPQCLISANLASGASTPCAGIFWDQGSYLFPDESREEYKCGSQWLDARKLPETMHKLHYQTSKETQCV